MKKFLFLSILSVLIFSCQPEEDILCDGVICENGGDCFDGTCNCPEMWEGTTCSQQKTPLTISVESFELTNFSDKNADGNDWDSGADGDARPDLYFSLENGNGSLFRSTTLDNRSSSAIWNSLNLNVDEVDFSRDLSLLIWDEDVDGNNDFVVLFDVRLYENTDGFPGEISISKDGGTFAGKLKLKYNY